MFFPVLPKASVSTSDGCVCVGGRAINRIQINRNQKARGGGDAITHPGKGTGEALFTCYAYVLGFLYKPGLLLPKEKKQFPLLKPQS